MDLRVLKNAFTMAEILLSLTIIGVVAAITLPSLTGNINERTWNTQRKALYARMSQAISLMPNLNGYGTVTEATSSAPAVDTAAETFITSGLSKVLKINNICSPAKIEDCGLSSKITTIKGNIISLPKTLGELNSGIIAPMHGISIPDTKAAAFETANGESILVFYNKDCTASNVEVSYTDTYAEATMIKQQVCANFVFDLNGSKGPNTVGRDIGIMSAIYSSDSQVVMPVPNVNEAGTAKHADAGKACRNQDSEYRLPNVEELITIYYNKNIFEWDAINTIYWSSNLISSDKAYVVGVYNGVKAEWDRNSSSVHVWCVKR